MSAMFLERGDRLRRAWGSPDIRWAAGLTVLGLILRMSTGLLAGRTVLGFGDPVFYHGAAISIANGTGFEYFGQPTVHWPPGYPFVLAGVYKLFGTEVTNALVLNAVLGALTIPLAYVIARRAFGRAAAVITASALAVFPGQILMADLVLSETLYTLELTAFLALAATLRSRPRSILVLGLVAGAAALTRGEGVLFPVIVLAMGWSRGVRLDALRRAALVAAVMLATIAPWTVRNALTVHAFVPVSTNASDTLWSGHNPIANGGPVYSFQTDVLRRVRRGNFEVEASALLRRQAISYAVHHPLRELELIPLKLRSLARGDSEVISVWINARGQHPLGARAATWIGRLADLSFYALLAGLLLAVAFFRRTLWGVPAARGALAFVALAVPLYGFVYYGNFRYRIPLEPLMLLLVAPGVAVVWDRLKALGHSPSRCPSAGPAGVQPRIVRKMSRYAGLRPQRLS